MPGGVNSPVRAFKSVGGVPRFMRTAQGAYMEDVDGKRYLDLMGSWGVAILGHGHPGVRAAVEKALEGGTSFGAPTPGEVEIAELVVELVPSVEVVRFVNSGTEATLSAIRLARAVTERDRVIKFRGGYHGHGDAFLVAAGSGAATLGVPSSPGVPASTAQHTLVAEFNDLGSVEALFDLVGDDIAAVIVEPVAGNMGCIPPAQGFLTGLRALCTRDGALLVFDEVMTGFRVGLGGAQERYGVTPDLTTLAKVIGGGLPVGAYGGRRDLMRQIAPDGPVYQAGTLSGNPLAMAAGLAVLRYLVEHPEVYDRVEATGVLMEPGVRIHRAERAGCDSLESCGRHGIALLLGRAGHRLAVVRSILQRAVQHPLPRDAGGRRLPAAKLVRSLVLVGGARGPGDAAGSGDRRRDHFGDERMTVELGLTVFERACRGSSVPHTPIWIMRQAGRYLPEYRKLRETVDFVTATRTPEVAARITLQPMERFDLDAAILFSDIMTPLDPMGVRVDFAPGPVLPDPIRSAEQARDVRELVPEEGVPFVLDAIRLVRSGLRPEAGVIGFAGAPFTLFCYLVEGGGSKDFMTARSFLASEPDSSKALLGTLGRSMARYLVAQAEAGANAVMLFDSWVGLLAPETYRRFVVPVMEETIAAIRAEASCPVIYFAHRGATLLPDVGRLDVDVVGIDWTLPLSRASALLGGERVLQGNLGPGGAVRVPRRSHSRGGLGARRSGRSAGARLQPGPRDRPPHGSRPGGPPRRPRPRAWPDWPKLDGT